MSKFDEFDLDINKKGHNEDSGVNPKSYTAAGICDTSTVTMASCDHTCVDCVTETCTPCASDGCSGNTCSNCHSYCGGACRR